MLKFRNIFTYTPTFIVIGFFLVSLAALYLGSAPSLSQIEEGDVSLRTIYAPYEFTYPTSIDEKETEEARREFEAKVPAVYDIDASVQDGAFARLENFFDKALEASRLPDLGPKEKAAALGAKIDFELPDKTLLQFSSLKDGHKAEKASKDALENMFLIGIVTKEGAEELLGKGQKKVSIRNTRFDIEREIETKDLIDEKEADKILRDTLERILPRDRALKTSVYNLIKSEIAINTKFNEGETNARRAKARAEVTPIYRRGAVKKNELIVERGKRLTKDHIAKLTQITRLHAVVNRTSYISGLFILLVGLVLVGAVYLRLFGRGILRTPKYVLLIAINAFMAILASLIIVQSPISTHIIPLAGIGMILVLLLNVNTALITGFLMSVYIGFITGGKLDLTFMLFMGTIAGIYAVRGARRRSQIFFAGFIVALINFISIIGLGLLGNMQKEAILGEGLYGIANGVISSFIVIGLLPVFEYTFRLISNITLLELSDLSNPLLKELTIKAPGTYHHSILVGNLAEEACNAIGANSLLARVGSYYHDIGKIEKAAYFVENEAATASKHEKLTPSMSALIITNHAKDGVELAKKHKLNDAIINFISQHHGTSLIYYFYQRALEKIKSEEELKEEEFRYAGPKPQTKETAIVLLADSVEASSRMLSDPTPARIRGLVEKIMNNKFIDGQLDECDLTLKDLHKISESFVRVLMGIFHTRLEYPEMKSRKERKSALKNKNKQSR
jgi:putative nucleotidyltransferase with HDIG domain